MKAGISLCTVLEKAIIKNIKKIIIIIGKNKKIPHNSRMYFNRSNPVNHLY